MSNVCILESLIVQNAFLQSSSENFQVWLLKPTWCLSGRWWLLWWWGAWWHLRLAACASLLYWPTKHFHFTMDCFVPSVYAALLLSTYNCTLHLNLYKNSVLYKNYVIFLVPLQYFLHGIICTLVCMFLETAVKFMEWSICRCTIPHSMSKSTVSTFISQLNFPFKRLSFSSLNNLHKTPLTTLRF